jgi:hypothetical protein
MVQTEVITPLAEAQGEAYISLRIPLQVQEALRPLAAPAASTRIPPPRMVEEEAAAGFHSTGQLVILLAAVSISKEVPDTGTEDQARFMSTTLSTLQLVQEQQWGLKER